MKPVVELISVSVGAGKLKGKSGQEVISYCARVSNPNNQLNFDTAAGLLRYCIKQKHWSIFEQADFSVEVNTTRGIAAQILRHSSFKFQEFCLAGSSKITVSTSGGSVQRIPIGDLYNKWQNPNFKSRFARSYDSNLNRFIEAPILSVYKSGEKPVYEYTIKGKSTQRTIKCTREHRVFTKEQGFVPFGEAYDNNLTVALNGLTVEPLPYQKREVLEEESWMGSTKLAEKYGIAPIIARKWFKKFNIKSENPNNWPKSNIDASFEAKLTSFMKWARNNVREEYCEHCNHDGSISRLEISHKISHDGCDDLAFDVENLQTLCSTCHRKYDIEHQHKHYGWTLGMAAKWGKIETEHYLGVQETFDIEMDHPTHNFVADGIVVHNSQRYADTNLLEIAVAPDLRRQDVKNRQNSIDDFGDYRKLEMQMKIQQHFDASQKLYDYLVEQGVAKECSRFVLPLATPTRLYMKGSVRSWIHYLQLRTDEATQKEHRDVANEIKHIFCQEFPDIAEALEWTTDNEDEVLVAQ